MKKNILVTGGAGFIGSHLCENLLNNDNNIIILDNLNNFYDINIKKNNLKIIESIATKKNIKLKKIIGDIRDNEILDDIFKNNKIDLIIHLAAMAGVRPSIENSKLYYDVNINGTLNLLEYAKYYNVNKFIFASSSSIYGNNTKTPYVENDITDFQISPYGATKKSGELLCHVYHKLYNIDIICLRFFTVYGPRQRPDLAIHKFFNLILNSKPISMYGKGDTKRDYTYIDDIIQGIKKSINYLLNNNNIFEVFNIGSSTPITLKEMIKHIKNTLNTKIKIIEYPEQLGDVKTTYANINKAISILGYHPNISFKEGIKLFKDWYLINNKKEQLL